MIASSDMPKGKKAAKKETSSPKWSTEKLPDLHSPAPLPKPKSPKKIEKPPTPSSTFDRKTFVEKTIDEKVVPSTTLTTKRPTAVVQPQARDSREPSKSPEIEPNTKPHSESNQIEPLDKPSVMPSDIEMRSPEEKGSAELNEAVLEMNSDFGTNLLEPEPKSETQIRLKSSESFEEKAIEMVERKLSREGHTLEDVKPNSYGTEKTFVAAEPIRKKSIETAEIRTRMLSKEVPTESELLESRKPVIDTVKLLDTGNEKIPEPEAPVEDVPKVSTAVSTAPPPEVPEVVTKVVEPASSVTSIPSSVKARTVNVVYYQRLTAILVCYDFNNFRVATRRTRWTLFRQTRTTLSCLFQRRLFLLHHLHLIRL